MRRLIAVLCAIALLPAARAASYRLDYAVRPLPDAGVAEVRISTAPRDGRLHALDLDMPPATYRAPHGDGRVERRGARVLWVPPRGGGALHYRVVIDHRRGDRGYDSRLTSSFMITRGDRLVPPARARASAGSAADASLSVELPDGWTAVEAPFPRRSDGSFVVADAGRRFDRPVGWIAAGTLDSVRESIAGTELTLTAPRGVAVETEATLALLREALPPLRAAFGALPPRLLVVRGADPMWRGGLSAPRSLWLHAERPLVEADGTSPVLHELVHVVAGIRGAPGDDWIAEGLAEFYSIELRRRAGLIDRARFDALVAEARAAGADVATLRARESRGARTRKALASFADLDRELRDAGGLDALVRELMRGGPVSLHALQAAAERLTARVE